MVFGHANGEGERMKGTRHPATTHITQPRAQGWTRRDLLAALAAAGAAAALPSLSRAAGAPTGTIDIHHHVFPEAFMDVVRSASVSPAVVNQWSLQRTLEEMDRNRVRTSVVSITQPGVWVGDVQRSRTLARQCNEYMARLRADHPGSFGFLAALPLPDPEGSLRELEYALDVLHADGVGLMTSYGNTWVGDPAYASVLAELDRRRCLVHFHPTGADCCRGLMPNVSPNLIEYPQDTARAIMSLLYSGTFAARPNIRYVFCHAGGTMPVLAGRVQQLATPADKAARMPDGINRVLQGLYYDMANAANASAFAALTNIVPVSQLVFGSDYPYVPVGATDSGLETLGLSPEALASIRSGTLLRLLPQLARA
jgi:predicted TIM-barrel fold metal-dependent hydrolase